MAGRISERVLVKLVLPLSMVDNSVFSPMYRLKTTSQQIGMVLSALAEGLDPSAVERVFGYRQATITTWLTRAGEHAQTLHEHSHLAISNSRTSIWMNCEPGCAATNRFSGCGWPSTPARRFFPSSISAPHAEHGASAHPLLGSDPGPWLPPTLHE